MRDLLIKNTKLENLLSNIIDVFFSEKYKKFLSEIKPQEDKLIPDLYPCSDEYLQEAFKHKVEEFGYPRAALGLNKDSFELIHYDYYTEINNKVQKVGKYLGSQRNTLAMCYPDNGYIGWHHNGNAPGYNVLLTYSQDGDGHFTYWDYATNSIVRLQDKPGWNLRVGYYANQRTERDKLFWHMAETNKQRITVAWVLNHKEMWSNMIDELTSGEYDPSVLEQ